MPALVRYQSFQKYNLIQSPVVTDFFPLCTQFVIKLNMLVEKVYTPFIGLKLSHTYVTTKTWSICRFTYDTIFLKRNLLNFSNCFSIYEQIHWSTCGWLILTMLPYITPLPGILEVDLTQSYVEFLLIQKLSEWIQFSHYLVSLT